MIETTVAKFLEYNIRNYASNLFIQYKRLLSSNLKWTFFSSEEIENLYALGYDLFIVYKFDLAKQIFEKLSKYQPTTGYFYRAIGAVDQQMKNYKKAIESYNLSIANEHQIDYPAYVYRAESKILSGQVDSALIDLEFIANKESTEPQSVAWVNRAKLLLRLHKKP